MLVMSEVMVVLSEKMRKMVPLEIEINGTVVSALPGREVFVGRPY